MISARGRAFDDAGDPTPLLNAAGADPLHPMRQTHPDAELLVGRSAFTTDLHALLPLLDLGALMLRLLVCGGRDYRDEATIFGILDIGCPR
jgi:hypothetical protein